jgi:hypothetical protein
MNRRVARLPESRVEAHKILSVTLTNTENIATGCWYRGVLSFLSINVMYLKNE